MAKTYHHSPRVVQCIVQAPAKTAYMVVEHDYTWTQGPEKGEVQEQLRVGSGVLDYTGHHVFFLSRTCSLFLEAEDGELTEVDTSSLLGDGPITVNASVIPDLVDIINEVAPKDTVVDTLRDMYPEADIPAPGTPWNEVAADDGVGPV